MTHRTTTWNAPYTFSGKEKDVETGYGYFGARYYDSGLSIWLSVDPMSDKYPSMSPYNYCANNPVILVDPDGERIIIVLPNLRLEFKNGKLYNTTDNTLYSGDNQFARSVENGLNQIKDNSLLGKAMVEVLEQIDYDVNISATSGNPKEYGVMKSLTEIDHLNIELNPNGYAAIERENGNDVLRYDMVGDMAHEISHAFFDILGLNDDYIYFHEGMRGTEWIACYMENTVRQDLGKNLRSFYQGITVDPEEGRFWIDENAPQLLDRNGNKRINFFR